MLVDAASAASRSGAWVAGNGAARLKVEPSPATNETVRSRHHLYQIASDRQATHPGRRVCEQNKGELRRRLAALFVTSCITRLRVRWSSMFRRSGARDATGTRQTASSCLTPPTLKS